MSVFLCHFVSAKMDEMDLFAYILADIYILSKTVPKKKNNAAGKDSCGVWKNRRLSYLTQRTEYPKCFWILSRSTIALSLTMLR